MQVSFLSSVPDIELITDHAIFAYIINFALSEKIKYIISGVNFATEHSTIPSCDGEKMTLILNKIHLKFGKEN